LTAPSVASDGCIWWVVDTLVWTTLFKGVKAGMGLNILNSFTDNNTKLGRFVRTVSSAEIKCMIRGTAVLGWYAVLL
jgi:hypothetical protein